MHARTPTRSSVHIHTHPLTHSQTQMHNHTHTHMHAHTSTHPHTHTRTAICTPAPHVDLLGPHSSRTCGSLLPLHLPQTFTPSLHIPPFPCHCTPAFVIVPSRYSPRSTVDLHHLHPIPLPLSPIVTLSIVAYTVVTTYPHHPTLLCSSLILLHCHLKPILPPPHAITLSLPSGSLTPPHVSPPCTYPLSFLPP